MRKRICYFFTLVFVLSMASCIKNEEMPNSEADIISLSFSDDILSTEPVIENDRITIFVKAETDVTALSPTFEITEGATIIPKSGTERDFTKPISYIVISEDRRGIKEYIIEVKKPRTPFSPVDPEPGTTDPEEVAITGITIYPATTTIEVGNTQQLTAIVEPEDATNKTVLWISGDEEIAVVDENGLVTAKSEGEVIVVAVTSNGQKDICIITTTPSSGTTEPEEAVITGVTISPATTTISVGGTLQLTAIVEPENVTNKTIIWESSDEEIAVVDENGLVRAKTIGEAIIIATTSNGKTATCKVIVEEEEILVETISFGESEYVFEKGDDYPLVAYITPLTATDKTITWESSNPQVATVVQNSDSDGNPTANITAIELGETTITATTSNGKIATCKVIVEEKEILVETISFGESEYVFEKGGDYTLVAYITPLTATDRTIQWESSNQQVATVAQNNDSDGNPTANITAIELGETTITATTSNGKIATCKVIVTEAMVPVTSVTLNKTKLDLEEGESEILTVKVNPDDATNKAVIWESSNTLVAIVSNSGEVTALAAGNATITATSLSDETKKADCSVTVTKAIVAVASVTLNKTQLDFEVGESATLTPAILPSNATNKNVLWESNNTSVAIVSESGVVTAKSAGSATITVTTADGNKTATCNVTVKVSVTGVSLNQTSLSLEIGKTETLTAAILPSNATNKNVLWKSNNTSVATVSESGVVTAKAAGSAIITVTTADGNKTAACTVTVTVSVTGVTLNKSSLSLAVGKSETLTPTILPSDATNKSVTWKSNDTSVATVSAAGVVTAKAAGSTTITVTTADGNKTATCNVIVTIPVTGVTLNKTSLSLEIGKTETLTATILPSNATNKNVSWKSDNNSVATVSSSGAVTAKAAGSATITATTADGSKTATCTVTVTLPPWKFHFEEKRMSTNNKYEILVDDPASDGNKLVWTSGNEGFAITSSGGPKTYPTSQSDDGYVGKSVKLTTSSTGTLGSIFGSPIAAGNLFIGTFKLDMSSPAKSTHFGEPFYNTPKKIEGYYKYKAGATYKDKNNVTQPNKKDNFDIYAVLFETSSAVPYLDGTNILTHANVVSVARIASSDKQETEQWTHFEIKFEDKPGKSIDPVKLANGQYSITIVMSSSENGASFEGAVGSTLYVDELTLFME